MADAAGRPPASPAQDAGHRPRVDHRVPGLWTTGRRVAGSCQAAAVITELLSARFSGSLPGPVPGWAWLVVVVGLLVVWAAAVRWERRDRARACAHREAWARRQRERAGPDA